MFNIKEVIKIPFKRIMRNTNQTYLDIVHQEQSKKLKDFYGHYKVRGYWEDEKEMNVGTKLKKLKAGQDFFGRFGWQNMWVDDKLKGECDVFHMY